MTHNNETQTFTSLDALDENGSSDNTPSGGERYLTANGDNFVGIAMAEPAVPYRNRRNSGSGSVFDDGGFKDDGTIFEVTASRT
jgi:hypothetical protein